MTDIKYSENLNNHNNLVFFISNTKELNNISLPVDLKFDLKNKNFMYKIVRDKKIKVDLYQNNIHYKIIFILLDINDQNLESVGSLLVSNFNFKDDKSICLLFSKKIISNHLLCIPKIILGFKINL